MPWLAVSRPYEGQEAVDKCQPDITKAADTPARWQATPDVGNIPCDRK